MLPGDDERDEHAVVGVPEQRHDGAQPEAEDGHLESAHEGARPMRLGE